MKKKLISIAIASLIATGSGQTMAAQDEEVMTSGKKQVTAISIGAVSGALLAGPAGLVVGGLVGAIAGRQGSESEVEAVDHLAETETMLNEMLETSRQEDVVEEVMVASVSHDVPVIEPAPAEAVDNVQEIISNDLSMDVYFKAGSVDVENFYTHQLSVLLNLLNEIPELRLNLDGYSDRQGSEADNLQLSIARLESVREYFVDQGIDDSRININAHGEKNFVSAPGDLDAYVFDRRVVVSFESAPSEMQNSVAAITDASSI
ncbi:MAG: OmpA family protein [Gammaproteobacteria bacterium]|nr:OmpA family protein [Gammaproteobacteria bacterium]MCW8924313.1 OmpA family protein [Gammaproteobacteria bacterium]